MSRRLTFGLTAFAVLSLLNVVRSVPSAAHERSVSYSSWDIRGQHAHVTVRLSQLDASRFPWAATSGPDFDRGLGTYLATRLQLLSGDAACAIAVGPRPLAAVPGRLVYEWHLACPDGAPLRVQSTVLLDVAPSHLHFARVTRDGGAVVERVLSEGEQSWRLADVNASAGDDVQGSSLLRYLVLGIEHIWTGYDHMAFLLALLLIESALFEVAKVVTGFTVAHSMTLGLATLGYVRPEATSVEALIGLSIALVAAEDAWLVGGKARLVPWMIAASLALLALLAGRGYGRVPALTLAGLALFSLCYFGLLERVARPTRLRWAIAFLFGLVHGFGFAAVLTEAHLSPERLARGLFGFNLGVEAGQLAVVIAIWPLLRVVARVDQRRFGGALIDVAAAAVFSLGVFWFVLRAYG